MSPKTKAFLVICTYGTVGGSLLGFASMAFGTNSRAIAQGASLGLYAGIAFGAYVVNSHGKPAEVDEYQQDPQGPPPGFGDPAGSGFGDPNQGGFGGGQDQGGFGGSSKDDGGFFGTQRATEINDDLYYNYRLDNKKGRGLTLPVYINLYNATF